MASNNKCSNKNTNSQSPKLPFITRIKLFFLHFLRLLHIDPIKTHDAPSTKQINGTVISTSDISVDPSRDLWFRLFIPGTEKNNTNTHSDKSVPLIVYFHGGGFNSYSADNKIFHDLCSKLAAKVPAVVASVNYRLTPTHKYPSQYDDGSDALKFIDSQNYAVLPAITDLDKCFVMGDSAGGNIAHHVTVRSRQNDRSLERVKITGVIGLQPFFGGEERTQSEMRLTRAPMIDVTRTDKMWMNFLPEGADRNHPAAHVCGGGLTSEANVILKNLDFPRTLVITEGYDPLQDWDRRYVEGLKECGTQVELIECQNAFHGFYGFPELPEYALLFDDVASFIRKA